MQRLTKQQVLLAGSYLMFSQLGGAEEAKTARPDQLDEIVVVGEKSERSQAVTGSSLSVYTEKDFKRRADWISTTALLQNSANILDTGLGNELPTVRGIDGAGPAVGAVAFFAGSRPRLNLSVDGRSATYNELAFGTKSLWDMKQVEIYRGAQSYAQGRNAVAGSVVMISNDPSDEFEGATKFSFGNQNYRQFAAMLSGPLVKDELSFRLSAERQSRTSFVDLQSYQPVGDPRRFETLTARAKLLWTPSALPDFYSRLTYHYIDAKAPQNEVIPQGVRYAYEKPVFKTGSKSGIWDIGWQISDQWKWENQLIYSKYTNDRRSLPVNLRGNPAALDGKEIQWEPKISFKSADQKTGALLGLYYFRSKQHEWVDMNARLGGRNRFNDKTETKALFGEIRVTPLENMEVTFAARYEQERHQRHGGSSVLRIQRDKTDRVLLPKLDIAFNLDAQQRIGFRTARGYNPGGAGVTFLAPYASYEYNPEYVWNYELYHRWSNAARTLELNSNLFYNDYKDMQLAYANGLIGNAEKARTYGAEFNLNWKASEQWNVYAALGLLKTKIKKYSAHRDYENKELSRAPNYTLSVGSNYRFSNGWEIGADARFTDGYYSNYANNATGKISAYAQTNAYLAYNFKQGRVTLFVDNLFNDRSAISVPSTVRGEAALLQPRLFGISTELRF
ncbi:TonB-dependent receptor [Aggregatibacter segnis]|uniref:TonB-dependent receptor n=1 Tax=Aggregatibacter segnis TaxID=739 RepID=UPI000D698252|nr:TonB-dependent receptor [Aggregatibacter segnis]